MEKSKMRRSKTVTNIIFAFVAQSVSLVLSFLMSLIVPKLLGTIDYSYWQLFIFYGTYVGLFHFGFCDGIYLKLGGVSFDDLDKNTLKSEFFVFALSELFLAAGTAVVWCFLVKDDTSRVFVLIFTAIYLVLSNLNTFFGYLFQAANETNVYSIGVLIEKCFFLISLACLLVLRVRSFQMFVLFYVISRGLSLIYLLLKGRRIFRGKFYCSKGLFAEIFDNIKVGIPLTIAGVAGMLIIGSCQFIFDTVWGIESFGKFSFSISLSSFVLSFINQVGMVLFPALRLQSPDQQKKNYLFFQSFLTLFLPIALFAYFAIRILIPWWLPKYSESVQYLCLLVPICTCDGKMQMLCGTYFKVLRKEKTLLFVNLLAFVLSFGLGLLSAYILKNQYLVICSAMFAIIVRNCVSELYLGKLMGVKISTELLSENILTFLFIISAWYGTLSSSFAITLSSYLVFLLINKKSILCVREYLHSRRIARG